MSDENTTKNKEMHYITDEEFNELIQCLPKVTMRDKEFQSVKYENFWYCINYSIFRNVVSFQKYFVARDTDIFVTGFPKTGTTWLKTLLFATVNRKKHRVIDQSPLLTHHPQEIVYNLEGDVYGEAFEFPRPHHLHQLPSPRLLSTHVPYSSLPKSIKTSGCRILYICRNPLDTLVSFCYFVEAFKNKESHNNNSNNEQRDSVNYFCLEDNFEEFCDGKIAFGPFFEHIVEYWRASLEQPNKVLFLQYEDLKADPTHHLKKIAEFVGMPFSSSEENEGVIQQIVDFCSIKNIKELDVNKSGVINKIFEKKSFFRKGEVGDWTNHITPSMVERMNKLMDEKLKGTGLSFKLLPTLLNP